MLDATLETAAIAELYLQLAIILETDDLTDLTLVP